MKCLGSLRVLSLSCFSRSATSNKVTNSGSFLLLDSLSLLCLSWPYLLLASFNCFTDSTSSLWVCYKPWISFYSKVSCYDSSPPLCILLPEILSRGILPLGILPPPRLLPLPSMFLPPPNGKRCPTMLWLCPLDSNSA